MHVWNGFDALKKCNTFMVIIVTSHQVRIIKMLHKGILLKNVRNIVIQK